jgi:hypothetical protein
MVDNSSRFYKKTKIFFKIHIEISRLKVKMLSNIDKVKKNNYLNLKHIDKIN